jgi:hypothetical protein
MLLTKDVSLHLALVNKYKSQILESLTVENCINIFLSGQKFNQYAPLGIPENCCHNFSNQVYGSDLRLLRRCSIMSIRVVSLCVGVRMVEPASFTSHDVQ